MQDFYDDACDFLNRARSLILSGDYQISVRPENETFSKRYGLRDAAKKELLLQFTPEDCIDISPNNNQHYENADVYKFVRTLPLESYGETEIVPVYAKMYILEKSTYDFMIVISLHESKKRK